MAQESLPRGQASQGLNSGWGFMLWLWGAQGRLPRKDWDTCFPHWLHSPEAGERAKTWASDKDNPPP